MALGGMVPDDGLPLQSDGWMADIRRRSAKRTAGMATTIPWGVVRGEVIPDTLAALTKRS